MTGQSPEQAAAHAFVTGCVRRGITAGQAAVPPEGQLATVRGLWADVAHAAITAQGPAGIPRERVEDLLAEVTVSADLMRPFDRSAVLDEVAAGLRKLLESQ